MTHPDSYTYAQCHAIQASLRGLARTLCDTDREIHAATNSVLYGSDAERAAARALLAARADLHDVASGSLCYEGSDGCCTLCGVEMSRCNVCQGVGYHALDCRLADESSTYTVGDQCVASGPGSSLSLESGFTYTVVAVYDGAMDIECARLGVTIAGVRQDDPALTRRD